MAKDIKRKNFLITIGKHNKYSWSCIIYDFSGNSNQSIDFLIERDNKGYIVNIGGFNYTDIVFCKSPFFQFRTEDFEVFDGLSRDQILIKFAKMACDPNDPKRTELGNFCKDLRLKFQ